MKSMIKHKLKLTEKKIYARNCEIKEVDINQRILFFNQNHIQGADKSKMAYGLYHQRQLVAVMSFSTPRYNQKFKWELIRFASRLNTSIIGGFSKLLNHFIKNNDCSNIVTYSSNDYYNGNLYLTNGFTLVKENPPSYFYIWKNKRYHRSTFSKKKLKKYFPDDNLTEKEMISILRILKTWNSGSKTWVLELDKK